MTRATETGTAKAKAKAATTVVTAVKRACLAAALVALAGCGEVDPGRGTLMLEVRAEAGAGAASVGVDRVEVELWSSGAVRRHELTGPLPMLDELTLEAEGDGVIEVRVTGYLGDQALAWGRALADVPSGQVTELTVVLGWQPLPARAAAIGQKQQAIQGPKLTVARTGAGTGTVLSNPAGINCGTDCEEMYLFGSTVTLIATPAPGSVFVGWSGACVGTVPTCTVVMTAERNVIANFAPAAFVLTVTRAGAGSGTVISAPSGISCGGDCSESYASGTVVTLVATPTAGSVFVGWSGACVGSGPCHVSMTATRNVTATFAIQNFLLTVTRAGAGTGTVVSNPGGISCGLDCTESYPSGYVVTLVATPAAGSVFLGWSGACVGTGPCNVSMTAARNVTATFGPASFVLTVLRAGSGAGFVQSNPGGIWCGTDCSESYPAGYSVVLIASPDPGHVFVGWSGACVGTGMCNVSMTAARTVTATFN